MLNQGATYSIEPGALAPVEQWITERRSAWERRLERLGDFLAGQPDQGPTTEEK